MTTDTTQHRYELDSGLYAEAQADNSPLQMEVEALRAVAVAVTSMLDGNIKPPGLSMHVEERKFCALEKALATARAAGYLTGEGRP